MSNQISNAGYIEILSNKSNLLIIQDIDGVCIPLVNNPMNRVISRDYVMSANKLKGNFYVLTNGEHGGKRGVNRVIEKSFESNKILDASPYFLPGLAAGGVEYQNESGNIVFPGVRKDEINFLKNVPNLLNPRFLLKLKEIFPKSNESELMRLTKKSILDTRLSPTINLNALFKLCKNEIELKIKLQEAAFNVMQSIMLEAGKSNMSTSFYLHIAPNLGKVDGKELIKYANEDDIGTTDIQFMISNAVKDAGVLFLLNTYIKNKTGVAPFGDHFNVREAPKLMDQQIELCLRNIKKEEMPTIVGVGDTVTSSKKQSSNIRLRGGSDRTFLTLIQEIGKCYDKNNIIIFVDSSDGEVYRPSINSNEGITDKDDILKFNITMTKGHKEYLQWFQALSREIVNKRN